MSTAPNSLSAHFLRFVTLVQAHFDKRPDTTAIKGAVAALSAQVEASQILDRDDQDAITRFAQDIQATCDRCPTNLLKAFLERWREYQAAKPRPKRGQGCACCPDCATDAPRHIAMVQWHNTTGRWHSSSAICGTCAGPRRADSLYLTRADIDRMHARGVRVEWCQSLAEADRREREINPDMRLAKYAPQGKRMTTAPAPNLDLVLRQIPPQADDYVPDEVPGWVTEQIPDEVCQ